jgi:hypothetical protein
MRIVDYNDGDPCMSEDCAVSVQWLHSGLLSLRSVASNQRQRALEAHSFDWLHTCGVILGETARKSREIKDANSICTQESECWNHYRWPHQLTQKGSYSFVRNSSSVIFYVPVGDGTYGS